ncbi:MAG: SAM-dependent methyltransferase [Myxococcaceae bacterium]|nr:SAM-dependent methyltransferase [Myxococcaceae bacterium]
MLTRLAESELWTRQKAVYEALGMRAWSDGVVPWRATTCPLLADVEAGLVAAFAEDVGPVTLVDVGAGTGRLAFHLARALAARDVPAHIILTDVAPSNLEALARQPQLAQLAATNRVSFATFDALAPTRLARGPVVLLAHYLFDTLPHAAHRRRGDETFEGLVDVAVEPWRWSFEPAPFPTCLRGRGDGTFLVPVGAARALEAWRSRFDGPLLVLAADKGVEPRSADELPLLARHGSTSAGVDFEALAALVEPTYRALAPQQPSHVFALFAFVSGATTPSLEQAWRARGSRGEVLSLLEAFERLLGSEPDVSTLLAFLERTAGDPDLLAQLAGRLRAATLDEAQARTLVRHLATAGDRHFVFPQQLDVPFELAITAHHLGALELACALYTLSLRESGAHPSTLLNLALAHEALGRRAQAKEVIEVLLAHTPDHPRALALLEQWAG